MKGEFQQDREDGKLFNSSTSFSNDRLNSQNQTLKRQSFLGSTSDSQQQRDISKNIKSSQKQVKFMRIFIIIILMILSILLVSNYGNLKRIENFINQNFLSQKNQKLQEQLQLKYKSCPDPAYSFHVNCNSNELKPQYPSVEQENLAIFCGVPVLGNKNFVELATRWNLKYPKSYIELDSLKTKDQKQDLLALLKLYFTGGTYISSTLPYSQIDQRPWRYTLTGFDTVFIDYQYITEQGIYVPDYKKFMKSRFPYSPQIKFMIQQFINKKDIMEECKERQCIIVKSPN